VLVGTTDEQCRRAASTGCSLARPKGSEWNVCQARIEHSDHTLGQKGIDEMGNKHSITPSRIMPFHQKCLLLCHYKYFNLSEWGTREDNTIAIKIYPHLYLQPIS